MEGLAAVAVVVVAYSLGTFPTAHLVGRRLGFDPTTSGSGNPGASNTTRVGGAKAGALVLLGDAGKGIAAAGLGYAVDGRTLAWLAGAAAIAGHMWPITRKLVGGKGVATAAGVGLVCAPLGFLVLGAIFALVAKVLDMAAPGSILVAALMPVGVWALGQSGVEIAVAGAIGLAIIVRHRTNIRRLLDGTESNVRA
ncbi:glycerol-3-phosphate acyltransferase [Actinospongicola halichondriae]|uniref:glycerol-3-phosphate acyltransferase n=1 Tax=Actinospongicola halichondriae TaxID=3236844 RepID=UPI003D3DAF42